MSIGDDEVGRGDVGSVVGMDVGNAEVGLNVVKVEGGLDVGSVEVGVNDGAHEEGLDVGNVEVGLAVGMTDVGRNVGKDDDGAMVGSRVGALVAGFSAGHILPFSEMRIWANAGLVLVLMLTTLTSIFLPSTIPVHVPPTFSFAKSSELE